MSESRNTFFQNKISELQSRLEYLSLEISDTESKLSNLKLEKDSLSIQMSELKWNESRNDMSELEILQEEYDEIRRHLSSTKWILKLLRDARHCTPNVDIPFSDIGKQDLLERIADEKDLRESLREDLQEKQKAIEKLKCNKY